MLLPLDPGADVAAHTFPSHMPDGQSALITIVRADGGETAGLVDLLPTATARCSTSKADGLT
jgi:hypothetical protein